MNRPLHRLVRNRAFALGALNLLWVPLQAQTLPSGGSIVGGSGSIGVNGNAMVVQQNSARMVTDWRSFSIGSGNAVRFVQPTADSVALNRVVGSDASAIFGSLTANGRVYLQNPNGVLFAPGAQVSVGSLVATSLNADADAFMQGQLRLSGGNLASGEVRNAGDVVTAPGGHVVLAGPRVANSGSISTPQGTTALVAGNAVNIDPTGSGLLNISVPVAALNAALGNSGTISADGGVARLQAAATDAALRTVMQVDGVVRARSIEQRDGQVILSGGASGVVRVGGTLDASGAQGGGGTVKVLGERVALVGRAHLDASGATAGGSVLVGGNAQGKGPEMNATDTIVGSGVTIAANAGRSGDGGNVVVWADGSTRFAGQIEARGGATQGDGGSAEVSGKRNLTFAGQVDLTAPNGRVGTLLLDPAVIDIVASNPDLNGDGQTGDDLGFPPIIAAGDFAGTSFPSRITSAAVATQLSGSNVSLAATQSLFISAPVTVALTGSATTLTLQAPQIFVNAATTLNNSSLVADSGFLSGSFISIAQPVQSLNSIALTSPSITQTSGSAVTAHSLTLNASGGSVILDSAPNATRALDLTALTANINIVNAPGVALDLHASSSFLSLNTNTGVTQSGGQLNIAGSFFLTSTAGDVVLADPNNILGSVSFNVAGNLTLAASGALNVNGTAGRNITLSSQGLFTMVGDIVSTDPTNPQLSRPDRTIIHIDAGGFDNSDGGVLTVPAGGQFVVRSRDFTKDALGFLSFGSGPSRFNILAFGNNPDFFFANLPFNTFHTNQTGTLNVPAADVGPVSRAYDGTAAMSYTLNRASPATASFADSSPFALQLLQEGPSPYSANAGTGQFNDKQAGIDKGYTTAPNRGTALFGASGATYYYLTIPSFTRAPGPSTVYPISEVTPLTLFSNGITAVNRVYDGTTAVALDTSGATFFNPPISGDSVSLVTTAAHGNMADKNVGTAKLVSITGLALGGADAANYSVFDANSARVDIAARNISSTGITAVNRVYDGTTAVALNTGSATLTGVLANDAVGLASSGATGTVATKNVGTAKPVSIAGVTIFGADAANYRVSDASGATVDITPRALASNGITAVNRVYDGTTAVALNTSAARLSGAPISGDSVSLVTSAAQGRMADKNAGTAKPVSITGVALGGADAANYSVSDASNASVDIATRPVTSTGITAVNRSYDGTTAVALNSGNATLTGVIANDAVTLAATTGTMANKNVGIAKPVTVSGLALSGADAANYHLSDASSPTVDIAARPVTSSGITAVNRAYDGTTAVALNADNASLSGVLANDAVTLATTGATGTMANKNVGSAKPVTVSGVSLGGADAANYSVSDASHPTVDIAPRVLSANGITAIDRSYDGTTAVALNTGGAGFSTAPAAGFSSAPVAGDSVALVTGAAQGRMADKNAGTAKPVAITGLALSGADAANYRVVDASGATVNIAALALVPSGIVPLNRVEDGTTIVALDTAGAAIPGILGGDAVSLVTSSAVGRIGSPTAGSDKPVLITGLSLTGADALNYRLALGPTGGGGTGGATVTIFSSLETLFDDLRFNQYVQAVSDAQEPFRRAMAEALAAGFGKENIRKQLQRGLVFETGLAAPAVDVIESAARPPSCAGGQGSSALVCP